MKLESTDFREIVTALNNCVDWGHPEVMDGKETYYLSEVGEDMTHFDDLTEELRKCKLTVTSEGDHDNDYQLVEYTFTCTHPDGDILTFTAPMSLMAGFNDWVHLFHVKAEKYPVGTIKSTTENWVIVANDGEGLPKRLTYNKHGVETKYHPNGVVSEMTYWERDEKLGTSMTFDEEGQVLTSVDNKEIEHGV